jgi:pimeloyl-ACP methyl ester carboxylesterase
MLSIPRWIPILAAMIAGIYAALCIALFVFQRSLIYYPQPRSLAADPDTLTLTVGQIRILVSTRPHPGTDAVIYLGGNAEDVTESLPTLQEAFPDRALYAMRYRGFGGSIGKPSEAALISDALLLFDKIHAVHPHIIVIGRSLGSGVAVHLASVRPVERLVLVTPYNSLEEIAAKQFPVFPVRWLLLDKFESWRYAPQVTAPTLLLAAEHDEVIPRASTERLYTYFSAPLATLAVIRGASHNTLSDSPEYVPILRGGASP